MPTPSTPSPSPSTVANPTRPSYEDSPIAKTENSSQATVLENNADSRYLRLAEEIQKSLVGPMPVEKFLQFLPEPHSGRTMPSPRNAFDNVPTSGPENEMNKPVADAFNKAVDAGRGPKAVHRCPGIKFYNTGNNREKVYYTHHDNFNSKYDITGYLEQIETEQEVATKQTMPGRTQILVELKLHNFAKDPEPDSDSSQELILFDHLNEKQAKFAIKALGQQVSYATEICARQHRNFLFTVFMTHTEARLLRWDRAGVVISASFNYRTSPELLFQFLWRFGNATAAERGCDTTVRRASVAEENLFKSAIEQHVRSQLGDDFPSLQDEYERHYEANSVIKIPVWRTRIIQNPQRGTIDGESAAREDAIEYVDEEVDFLVSRPVVNPTSMASRGTRGYWALNLKTERIVFLKDVWRTNVAEMEKEGDILQSIMDQGVPNVPTLICYGDVGDTSNPDTASPANITQTDRYKGACWNAHHPANARLTSRVHYRQVIEEAGYTLEHMAGSRELFRGARDAFRALQDAYGLCTRLHRDVSSTNIILFADANTKYRNRRGILIDWELSCVKKEGDPREHWRTGTWAFMSINTLSATPRPHQLFHDVESLVYVVFYCAIFFLSWNYTESAHRALLLRFFDQTDIKMEENEPTTGGEGKRRNLLDPLEQGYYFEKAKGMPKWIDTWLKGILKPLARCYTKPSKSTFKAQAKATRSLFQDDDFCTTLPNNDRECHERPGYRGPSRNSFPATQSSASLPSMPLENPGKRKSSSIHNESKSKRQHTAQEIPPEASSSRRSSARIPDHALDKGTTMSRRQKSAGTRSSSKPELRQSQ